MYRSGWILLIAVLARPLSAQEAAMVGVVRDSSSGLPLGQVTVAIPATDLITRTGPDGVFRLRGVASGEHTVFVRKPGYEPWAMRLAVTVTDERDISLGTIALARAFEATFFGTVIDSATGLPVAEVTVGLTGHMHQTVTDDSGYFELPGIRSGTHEVTARRIGFESWAMEFELSVPQPLRVDFGRIPLVATGTIELEDIIVEGEQVVGSMIMTEFFTRRRTEQGTFLTYVDIERLNPKTTSDIFRIIPGMNAYRNGIITSGRGSGSLQGFEPCTVQYYLDGIKVTASTIDVIQPNAIAGIEIYRGSATTPHIFRSQSNANCGVIAVWTKDGRPNRRSD